MLIDVYDFDGTIYDGDSTADFVLFCLRRHPGMILGAPRLAVAALTGIFMNAILPGKDYEFGVNDQGDTSVNFGPRND